MKWNACSAVAVVMIQGVVLGYSLPSQAEPPTSPLPAVQRPTSNSAAQPAQVPLDEKSHHAIALQVALDRAGFSPGEIDGAPGANTDRAMAAFKAAHGTTELGEVYDNFLTTYRISEQDVAGPFTENIPADLVEQSKLSSLSYTSVLELLGERFHSSPKLLQRLNPTATFASAEEIVVPNVAPFMVPPPNGAAAPETAEKPSGAANVSAGNSTAAGSTRAVTVIVTETSRSLQVQDADGKILLHAPVTVGSVNDPLPVGDWKINGVGLNPVFNYNPDLFWDADPAHAKAKIPPGPNNPVGVVWLDLTKEHFGIHGTPEPSRVGHTESHGCIRLTNWDAMRIAELVKPGTRVVLR